MVLHYFFWPGLKSDVVKFCRSCHTCQVSGKPNQVIPTAPLKLIPAVRETFEHVDVDTSLIVLVPYPKPSQVTKHAHHVVC